MPVTKAKLVKMGNGQAVRIPKTILKQANLREGDEIEIHVEDGSIWLKGVCHRLSLQQLVTKITPGNRHGELDWGKPVGDCR